MRKTGRTTRSVTMAYPPEADADSAARISMRVRDDDLLRIFIAAAVITRAAANEAETRICEAVVRHEMNGRSDGVRHADVEVA